MKARPILFSSPMIRALLAGRKTQTRRVVTSEWTHGFDRRRKFVRETGTDDRVTISEPYTSLMGEPVWFYSWGNARWLRCPYGKSGDLLWVRETWKRMSEIHSGWPANEGAYAANLRTDDALDSWGPWRPSIFMPRSFSRLTLRIIQVRVERLQEISDADCMAEGIEYRDYCYGVWLPDGRMLCGGSNTAFDAYRCLWISINGPESWAANPWVLALTFEALRQNVDAVMKAAA